MFCPSSVHVLQYGTRYINSTRSIFSIMIILFIFYFGEVFFFFFYFGEVKCSVSVVYMYCSMVQGT